MKNIFTLCSLLLLSFNSNAQNYSISQEIKIEGNGKWDFLSVDEVSQHLFVSHGNEVNVIDIESAKTIATINDTEGVHGIAIANDFNKAFISNGKSNTVTIVDLTSFHTIQKIKINGIKPDAILYDKFSGQVFVFNGKSNNVTVLDAKTNATIANIELGGKPELCVTNNNGLVYVNIEDKSEIKVINTKNLKVVNSWSISPGLEPTGLAIDTNSNRLFSGCANNLLIVADALTGKVISSLPIGNDCDGVVFDAVNHLIFSSNGEGNLTVIKEVKKDNFKVVQTVKTQAGAKTVALNSRTGNLYVPVADFEISNKHTKDDLHSGTVIKDDSFKVLVVKKL